jgi:hypothetical protein
MFTWTPGGCGAIQRADRRLWLCMDVRQQDVVIYRGPTGVCGPV